tara:strand:- start:452 stop:1036 length:585 start_codon:yes stop_codon:yes gene_type:complete
MYTNKLNNPEVFLNQDFIGVWDNVIKKDFCEHIINLMDSSTHINNRDNFHVQDQQLNLEAFDSVPAKHILDAVTLCLQEYVDWYPFLKEWNFHSSGCLLQKTIPTHGYHVFHSENSELINASRTLVWSVYFNDVEQGETEFLYQRQRIKPVEGRVAIFPGSFTHLHRGNPPLNKKYIATGWLATNTIGAMNCIM